ncbi:MAG TPA: CPBP family intramembrane metalloprotease, partial [Leptospiraceae bacterium]|nr:CPBP family intramembrane metalloprotease [Leptospiraceae bacterium]
GSLRMLAVGQVTDPMKEVAVGVMGFAAIFPPALLALLLTMGSAAQDSVRIAHPISFEIQKNPVLVFILAAVLVPIFEEVIFRCFLYGFFRREQRIRYAAFFSGSIFAILHPQGAIALPYLTILGMGLAVLREYRPSPLASMTAHACVNGTAVILGYAFTAL